MRVTTTMTKCWQAAFSREVARGGFSVARNCSRLLFVAFLSGEWLGACFFFAFVACRNKYSQLARFQCAEVVSCTNYGLHTA